MSQAGDISATAGPVPPYVPTDFQTDIGNANPAVTPGNVTPAGNIIKILGAANDLDTDEGILTDADPDNGNVMYVTLTNRIQGGTTTNDATPTTLSSYTMTQVGTYIFEMKASAFNVDDALGAGYNLFATTRFDGVNSYICGTPDKIANEEAGMNLCDFNVVVGGVGSGLVSFQGTGLAGKEIIWCSVGLFCNARV